MEIYEQVSKLDAVVIPAAGQFGLLAGTAAAIKHLNSQILVIVSPRFSPQDKHLDRSRSRCRDEARPHLSGVISFWLMLLKPDK